MQLQAFKYQSEEDGLFSEIKTTEINGEFWFAGSDVARSLGYKNAPRAITDHCREGGILKRYTPTVSGNQAILFINEPNVYRLIVKSKLKSSERFEKWLFEEVLPSIRKKGFYGSTDRSVIPNFLTRYKDNMHKIPHTYFSVITELFVRLYSELEKAGYVIPDKSMDGKSLMPDISVGMGFAKFLKENRSEFYSAHKSYKHTFPDGRIVEANMYVLDALPMFIRYIHEKWIPENAHEYFKKRDPIALDYLPKLLAA